MVAAISRPTEPTFSPCSRIRNEGSQEVTPGATTLASVRPMIRCTRAGELRISRNASSGEAGLAWDWVEVAEGVVAMADPMSLTTNLQLVTSDGQVLPAIAATLHFNQFVRRLPWQDEVTRLLRTA